MQVIAAEEAGDIEDLADNGKPRHDAAEEGHGHHFGRVHAAAADFRESEAGRARENKCVLSQVLQETFTFRFSYFGAAAVEELRGHEAVHEALGHAF